MKFVGVLNVFVVPFRLAGSGFGRPSADGGPETRVFRMTRPKRRFAMELKLGRRVETDVSAALVFPLLTGRVSTAVVGAS